MFMFPQDSYVEILIPSVMVALGGRAIGRCLGQESGDLMNGISVLIKGTPESSLAPLPFEDPGRSQLSAT